MHTILLLCIQEQRFYSEKELFIHEVEKKHSPNHFFLSYYVHQKWGLGTCDVWIPENQISQFLLNI